MLEDYLVLGFLWILRISPDSEIPPIGDLNDSVSPQIKFDFERGMWYHL